MLLFQIPIGIDNNGYLSVSKEKEPSNYHWIQSIRFSNDCHSYNAKLCLQKNTDGMDPNTKIIVEITRPIKAGHELQLWFSEDVLAILQMAFLTPANIQGIVYVLH